MYELVGLGVAAAIASHLYRKAAGPEVGARASRREEHVAVLDVMQGLHHAVMDYRWMSLTTGAECRPVRPVRRPRRYEIH